MSLTFEMAGAQIDGARDYQEDAFLITHIDDKEGNPSALIVIADGMGGHAAGNVASNLAVQAVNKHITSNYPSDDIPDILHEAILKANFSIQETISETSALAGMGCTMVVGLLESNRIWWASVGDSHLYLIRDNELIKKNEDHSYGGYLDRMEAEGTPVETQPGYSRNMLMSALTGDEISEIDVSQQAFELQNEDRILLCSDGMDTLSAGKIIQFSNWSENPKECVAALLNAVQEANIPRQDNTTSVVVTARDESQVAARSIDTDYRAGAEVEVRKPRVQTGLAEESIPPHPDESDDGEFNAPAGDESLDLATRTIDFHSVAPSSTAEAPQVKKETSTDKKFMFLGAAVVIIAVAVWFLFPQEKKGVKIPAESTTEIVASDDTKPAPPPTPVKSVEEPPAVVTQEEVPAPTEAAKPAPEPVKPAPTAKVKEKIIQDNLKSGGKGPKMIAITKGSFTMGAPNSVPSNQEKPRREVKVTQAFYIGVQEITVSEYTLFAKATGKRVRQDSRAPERLPVKNVSWDNAYEYTNWLSEQTGQIYRLPTEAEWEYAARGNTSTLYWWGRTFQPRLSHCFSCETGLDPPCPDVCCFF